MENEKQVIPPPPSPRLFLIVGDTPGPRCGHTLTTVYSNDADKSTAKLVLFGGATALEGAGKEAANNNSGIRLAGATNEVHIFDVYSGTWKKVIPQGEAPSPRAAHAGAAVGSMVVIQGGIGPAGLASEDLHVLDFTDFNRPKWHRVMVQGDGPGARYAHVLALVANRFLVVMGGNNGKDALGDAWSLDTSEKPYKWRKIDDSNDMPSARMYASSAARQDGLLLLCGGRDTSGTPMGDAYGFARHRDGRWEWATAPGQMPTARYQHAAVFVGPRLHITGGAVGGGKMVDENSAVVSLDTSAGVWCKQKPTGKTPDELMRRCRHATSSVGSFIFIYGGLKGSTLLSDFLVATDSTGQQDQKVFNSNSEAWKEWLNSTSVMGELEMVDAEEAAAIRSLTIATTVTKGDQKSDDENTSISGTGISSANEEGIVAGTRELTSSITLAMNRAPTPDTPVDVKLWHKAVVVSHDQSPGSLGALVRQLSLDHFENESRRVSLGLPAPNGTESEKPAYMEKMTQATGPSRVHRTVMDHLLRPRSWSPPAERRFFLTAEEISELCEEAEKVFKEEPTVLQLQVPVKIFGDLHGQFGDLMRLFDEYGYPNVGGDITYIDYLFLGDYVDRGAHSLEIICLLLSLKIVYPNNVHLIRGNHEAADINALFGFRLECLERLGDPDGIWAWQRINSVFNWLPLAANIQGKILCMHGGIGRSIETIDQISELKRPMSMDEGGLVLMDLLWSDPTSNDSVEGVQPSPRGPGLVTFGPDRVKDFCKRNGLQMIIRAHECVMDGFERFAQGHLITLFSATNYCGTANNAGAILVMGRNLVLVPKLIHPVPPIDNLSDTDNEDNTRDTWMQIINKDRPPTPPRGRPTEPYFI